jgi:hypothetical protein
MSRTVTLTFDDGNTHIYNNVPLDVTPEQVFQRASMEFQGRRLVNIDGGSKPKLPERNLLNAAGAQFIRGGSRALTGLDTAAAALAGVFGSTGARDDIYKRMEERQASTEQFIKENLPHGDSFAEKAVGAVTQIPNYINPLLIAPQVLGGGVEEQQSLNRAGVDPTTAQLGAGAATALQLGSLAIPGAGFVKGALVGGSTEAAETAGVAGVLAARGYNKLAEERARQIPEDFALGALIGGPAGAISRRDVSKAPELSGNDFRKNLDAVVKDPPKANELAQLELFDQSEMGRVANKYEAKLGDWRIDENGIPIKVDLSMEVQNLQNPLQSNLWGDELGAVRNPVGQSATLLDENGMQMEPRSLTEAIDSMEPAARTQAINERMVGEIDDGPLKAAALEAVQNSSNENKSKAIMDFAKLTPILGGETGLVNLKQTFNVLRNNAKQAKFFSFMNSYINKLEATLGNVTVRIGREGELPDSKAGEYRVQYNEVVLHPKYGANNYVLLHELTHAALDRWLYANRSGNNPIFKELAKTFEKAREHILLTEYGMKDIKEFLAEARSNAEFRALLQNIKVGPNLTALDKIKNTFYKVLGLKTKEQRNLLDDVLDWSDKAMAEFAADRKAVDKAFLSETGFSNIVSNAINQFEKTVSNGFPETPESQKQGALNRVPGLKDEKYITPDAEFTPELKQQFLEEKDGSSVWFFTPGRVARQEISGATNKMVATVGRYFENARNRYEILIDKHIEPTKRVLQEVLRNPKTTDMLHSIFMAEQKNKARFTEQQLKEAGAPESVINAYNSLRDNFDIVLDKINKVRAAKNKEPLTALDAYLSARWLGPWKARVYDKQNRLIYVIAEPSALARKRAIDYITSNEPSLSIREVTYDAKVQKEKGSLDATYLDLIDLLGKDDPLVKRVQELLDARNEATTTNVTGLEKHFKEKTGKHGYAGNRPWADSYKDQKEMFKQQIEYLQSSLLWAEQQGAIEKTNKILNDPEIKDARRNDVDYIKELAKMELGWDSIDVITNIEESVAKLTGQNVGRFTQALGAAKSYFYMHKLGLSIPYMAVSLIQPALVLPAAIIHNKANAFTTLINASLSGTALAVRQIMSEYTPSPEILKMLDDYAPNDFDNEAMRYAYSNRVTEVNQLTDVKDVTAGEFRQSVEKTVGATISLPELYARSFTYMGLVHGLKHQFDTSTFEGRLQLFQKAAEITAESMGAYSPEQKAPIYQRLGLVGNAMSVLQTFIVNQAYQVYKYSKEAAKGNPKPLIAHMAMMSMFAGATGVIGVDDAEDLINVIKKWLLSDEDYAKWKDLSIKSLLANNLSEYATYGLVSKATGLNLYSRFSMGDVVQAPPFENPGANLAENYFPFIMDIWKQGEAVKDLIMGNDLAQREAGFVLTPAGLRGIYEEKMPGVKRGDVVPQMSDMRYGQVTRDERASAIRLSGFRTFEEQRQLDQSFQQRVQDSIYNVRVENLRKKFQQNVVAGDIDAVKQTVEVAVKLGHNPSAWFNSISQTQLNSILSLAQRRTLELSKRKALSPQESKQLQLWSNVANAK